MLLAGIAVAFLGVETANRSLESVQQDRVTIFEPTIFKILENNFTL
jgi:hypothetical protein